MALTSEKRDFEKQLKSSAQPIGVFDSGVGGLTVLDALRKRFPHEDFVYLGDTANMPYGNLSLEALYRPIHEALDWFFNIKNVKFVVMACNTARGALTQWGEMEHVAKPHDMPSLIGPIAPLCRWLGQSDFRRVGLLATVATVNSNIYPETMACFNGEISLFQRSSINLVRRIEAGSDFLDLAELEELREGIAPLLAEEIEALVLGCTHYPHIEEAFKRILPEGITLLNPANHMPDALWMHLDVQELINPKTTTGRLSFYVSDDPERFQAISSRLPLKYIEVAQVSHWQ